MKLRHLRAAMAVASCGSMSSAAEAMNLSQPAITRIINLLETELGTRLFRRTQSGTEATAEGVLLVRAGSKAFVYLSQIEDPDYDGIADVSVCLRSSFTRQVPDHELAALIGIEAAGTIRRAAESMGITQTALVRSLAALAARIGRPLFEPQPPKRLCAWAAIAATKARRAFREIASTEELLRNIQATVRLRIGALPASRVHLVPEAAHRFTMGCLNSEISIVAAEYESLLSQLHSGELDLIVGSIRRPSIPSWVVVEPLFEDHLVVVSHPRHPLQKLPQVDWWDLRSARWVLPSKPTPIRAEFEHLMSCNGIPAPVQVVEVDSFTAARSFLLRGDWLGIFSASQIILEERNNLLRRLPMSKVGGPRQVGALTRRGEPTTPNVARFLGHLRAVASGLSLAFAQPEKGAEPAPKLIARDAN